MWFSRLKENSTKSPVVATIIKKKQSFFLIQEKRSWRYVQIENIGIWMFPFIGEILPKVTPHLNFVFRYCGSVLDLL